MAQVRCILPVLSMVCSAVIAVLAASPTAFALNLSPNPSGDEVIKCRPAKNDDDVWFVVSGHNLNALHGRPLSLQYFDLYPETTLPKEMKVNTTENEKSCKLHVEPRNGHDVKVSISPRPSKDGSYKGTMTMKNGTKEKVLCRIEPKVVEKFGCLEKNLDRLPASDNPSDPSDNESY